MNVSGLDLYRIHSIHCMAILDFGNVCSWTRMITTLCFVCYSFIHKKSVICIIRREHNAIIKTSTEEEFR